MNDESWRDDAKCKDMPFSDWIFFPDQSERASEARKVCSGCDVWRQCLEYALNHEDALHGVWGGTTKRERDRMRDCKGVKPPDIRHGTSAGARHHYRLGTPLCQPCRDAERVAGMEYRIRRRQQAS